MDLQLTANVATGLGFFIAAGSLLWQVAASLSDRKERRSEVSLREATEGFDEVIRTLKHSGNEREGWIAAACAVQFAETVADKVKVQHHKAALELARLRFRREVADELGYDNPQLTAAFFYGANEVTMNVDEAARHSTAQEGGKPSLKDIPEGALYVLWSAAQYPDDYNDSLAGDRFPEQIVESSTMRIMWPGLNQYLRHKRRYRSIGGQLRERK